MLLSTTHNPQDTSTRNAPEPEQLQHLNYWHRQLADLPSQINLPIDYSRPLTPGSAQGILSFTIDPSLAGAISALGAAEATTSATVLLAAYAVLLSRYADQAELVIGLPGTAGNADKTAAPGGCLLRANLTGSPSFRTVLRQVIGTLSEALSQQPTTLAQLAEELSAETGPGQPAIGQVLFAYHANPLSDRAQAKLSLQISDVSSRADLALVICGQGQDLASQLVYASDLFHAATIERLKVHFVSLLAGALAAPDVPIDSLDIVSAAEHAQLAAWNATEAPMELTCLHQMIAARIVYTPHAPAILFDRGRLSYAELDVRTNQLAQHLRQLGVGPERIVAVCMARGPQLIISLLAILKAGGAYLPLDPVYPAAHLAYMLSDAQPTVLISDGELPEGLFSMWQGDAAPPQQVDLTRDAGLIAGQPSDAPPDEATLDSLAYMIYTSGSTGRPKGVQIEHRSIAAYVLSCGLLYEVTRGDRGLHFSSFSFDASVDEIFVPLVHGAALVVTEGHGPPDFAALLELIARHQISLISLPTAYWHTWIAELSYSRAAIPAPLRLVIIGGEAASGERYNLWRMLAPAVKLINSYGPTETTVASTWYAPAPEHDEPSGPMAIGQPLSKERAYILDRQQRLAPIGVVGELYIGGIGLARGYHNRPELTAERFISVSGIEGEERTRLYRTGDLARWRHDGELIYYGRADQQVKVRGYRIEPGEIEATLRKHPAVQAATVITRPDPFGEVILAGYVVLSAPSVAPTELRDFLDARLPHYMVPSAIMVLEALPLTPGGKVDRRALPEPTWASAEPTDDTRARTHVEQVLTKIWQELLGRSIIGLSDNFFDLGGHSLLAMRMLVRVGSELAVKLPVSVMIHSATIAALAKVITEAGGASPWSVLVPIQPAGERPPLFCVHGFPGDVLWFHELGRCIGSDQPFYGLQSRSLEEGQPHALSIEQMAAWYNEGMRSVQPEGPYYICGASYGGVVAYEMARQLRVHGQTVALLVVLDYDPYARRTTLGERLAGRLDDLRRFPGWVRNEIALMSAPEFQGRMIRRLRGMLKQVIAQLLGGKKLPVDAADLMHYGGDLPLHRRELLIANDYAFENYQPQPYAGRVTLIASHNHKAVRAKHPEQTGWAPLAQGGVAIVIIPGSHETMFKPPYVGTLALRLRELMDAATGSAE